MSVNYTGNFHPGCVALPRCSCGSDRVVLVDVKIDHSDYAAKTKPIWHCASCNQYLSGRTFDTENVLNNIWTDRDGVNQNDDHDTYNGRAKRHELQALEFKLIQKDEYLREDLMNEIEDIKDQLKRKEPESELDKLRCRVIQFDLKT